MKRMILMMLLVAATVQLSAQTGEHRIDPRLVSKELGLTDDKAAAFAEIYTEYREAVQSSRPKSAAFNNEEKDDAKVIARINESLDNEIRIATIRKEYVNKFLKVLTPQQLNRLYMMDRMGGREMQRGGQNGGRPGPGGTNGRPGTPDRGPGQR